MMSRSSATHFVLCGFSLVLCDIRLAVAQCVQHEEIKLTATDGANGDHFGSVVAITPDTIVVGAYRRDCASGTDCGAAYVYQIEDGEWIQVGKLTASDANADDYFGWSVGISADTIVVGSVNDDCGAVDLCGSIYVFVKPNDGWMDMTQTAKLTASDGGHSQPQLGLSLSVYGDTVAATRKICTGGSNCLAVYAFVKPVGGWSNITQTAKLTVSDPVADNNGNWALSMSGDTIVVGNPSPNCGPGTQVCGSAYVYVKPPGGWMDMTESAELSPSIPQDLATFGAAVAISGDTVVVGAPGTDCGLGSACGAAYVYQKPPGGWTDMTEVARLSASDQYAGLNFGRPVSIQSDTIVASSFYHICEAGNNCGSAYVFRQPSEGWTDMTQSSRLIPLMPAANDAFAPAAISGDTIVVGAPEHFNNRNGHGSAYVFKVPSDCNVNGCPDDQDIATGSSRDCNSETVPDDCEIAADPGLDFLNFNGVIDACETPPEEVLADPLGDKIRFISFSIPASPAPAAVSAIRVKLKSMHHVNPPYSGGPTIPFLGFEFGPNCQEEGGCVRWVGPPRQNVESSSNQIAFYSASLQCTPHYQDWSPLGLLHVTGSAIAPSSGFEVENVSGVCFGTEDNCLGISPPVTLSTRRWGDVTAPYSPPSATVQPDVTDISALVDKFRSAPGAPIKARALLAGEPGNMFGEITPTVLNVDFNFSHISACVDAFRGLAYPYTIQSCP